MEKQATGSGAFLPVLSPGKRRLSFCKTSPKGLSHWLQGQPKTNLGKMARRIYKALLELNQLITSVENRLMMLELLRDEVFFICRQLETELLEQPLGLDMRAQQIERFYQFMQRHLAAGYRQVVTSAIKSGNINRHYKTLGIALQRTAHTLRTLLLHYCQLYCPPPAGLWLEIHRLYRLAVKLELHQRPQEDVQSSLEEISIEQTWITTLLLGCARTSQLHQESIAPLVEVFEAGVSGVKLQDANARSSLFVVDLQSDGPPHNRFLRKGNSGSHLLGLNLSGFVPLLQHLQQTPEKPSAAFNPLLLQHLRAAFGDASKRYWERKPAQDRLTLCVGLHALHFFLAGERSFESLLGAHRPFAPLFSQQEDAPVLAWGKGIEYNAHSNAPAGYFDFPLANTASASAFKQSGRYPLYEEQALNRSEGGYCLSWKAREGVQLSVGGLLGIREAGRKNWKIASVSWVIQKGNTAQVGVKLLAESALPCALQLTRPGENNIERPFLRGLLLASNSKIMAQRLIAPGLPFRQGDPVHINVEGKLRLALLERRQDGSINFNLFTYRLVMDKKNLKTALAKKPEPCPDMAGMEENFETLWKML